MLTLFEPQEKLKKYIQFYCEFNWKVGDPSVPKGHFSIPSGFSFVGFHRTGKMKVDTGGKLISPQEFYVNRKNTLPYRMTTEDEKLIITIACLKPTALFHLFGEKLETKINSSQDASLLFDNDFDAFVNTFKTTNTSEERISLVENLILEHIETNPWQANIIDEAVNIIFDSKGMISITDLVSIFNVNIRYFQKLFKKVIGISPSKYRNIVRFVFVFSEMSNTPSNDNKTFAALFNFYDTAHFSKAFKRFVGSAPSDFQIENFPFLKHTSIDNSLWITPNKK